MANDSGSQHEFNVVMLTSLYWANYYKHADMPVEKECFLTLAQLGVIAKIEENTAEFMKFGEVFDGGLRCTGKAGVESKKIAEQQNSDVITPDMCQQAFKKVASAIEKVRTNAGEAETEGPLC